MSYYTKDHQNCFCDFCLASLQIYSDGSGSICAGDREDDQWAYYISFDTFEEGMELLREDVKTFEES